VGYRARMSESTDRFQSVLSAFDARVQATPADAWGKPAPCEGWVARDVVAHVANNLRGFTGMDPVGADDEILGAWNASRDAIVGLATTGDLSTVVQGPFGPMPVEQILGQIISMDVLVHTWDLARAVGGDERLDPAVVSGAYSSLKPLDAMIRQPGFFAPKVEPPAGADEQTEFLCFLGRQV